MPLRLHLKRNKMLKSSAQISELFTNIPARNILSRDFLLLRFKLDLRSEEGFKHQIIVSKRLFKKARDRNLLKRRLRESVRVNQHLLPTNIGICFLVVYRLKKIEDFKKIDETIKMLFIALNKRLSAKP